MTNAESKTANVGLGRRPSLGAATWLRTSIGILIAAFCSWNPPTALAQGLFGGQPADEELYAIRCVTLRGTGHAERATQFEKALRQVPRLKRDLLRTDHTSEESYIFYGKYRAVELPGGQRRYEPDPRADLSAIRELSMPAAEGNDRYEWPFMHATIEALPTAAGVNPAWDLDRAEGYWSWHIAVFYNEGDFKQRRTVAEQYCKQLREAGEPAYFHHGPERSSVCIGLFPESSIRVVQRRNQFTGAGFAQNEIVDPAMLALQKKYPINLENGRPMHEVQRDRATGEIRDRVPHASFPVKTPAAERSERDLLGG